MKKSSFNVLFFLKKTKLLTYIENARIKLHQIFRELEEQNQPITARLLQEIFFGQDKEPEAVRTLIGTMQEHNDECRALVGKNYALITVHRYEMSEEDYHWHGQ